MEKKGTAEHLISVDEKIFDGNFLNTKIIDVKKVGYTHIIYGFIYDLNLNWFNWVYNDPKCCIKVGEIYTTSNEYSEMTVAEAVNFRVQQQRHSTPYDLIPSFCFPLKEKVGQHYIDNKFRLFLKSNFNCIVDEIGKGENVHWGITRNNINEMYEKYLSGERTLKTFKLFDEQRVCVNMMVDHYNKQKQETDKIPVLPVLFLLAAKCRFGKNFTILKFIEMIGFKNILFLSYKPEVFKSLKDDITGHKDFQNWKYINNRTERDLSPYDNNGKITTVVSTSVQQLIVDMNKNDENMCNIDDIENFLEYLVNSGVLKAFIGKIDLLVLDEAHFGGHTDYLNKIVDIIKPKMVIYVTGTASNFLNDYRFKEDENVYRYDYDDEREYHPEMPKLEIYTYKMDEYILKLKDQYNIDERPTMTKLCSDYNMCEDIMKSVLGMGGFKSRNDINFNKTMPYRNPDFEPYIQHTLWVFSNVECAKNMVKALKKQTHNNDFIIIDAAGDGCGVIKDIDKVKDEIDIAKFNNKKTITVTVERFREGVTVPKWGSVLLFDDSRSYNKNIQTYFRGQTPYVDFWNGKCKDKCLVFDFNPERCLEIRYEYIHEYKNIKYKTTEEWIKRTNDTMPLMYCDHCGELKKNDEVLEIMNEISRKKFEGTKCDNLLYQISSINSYNIDLSDTFINKLLDIKNKIKNKKNKDKTEDRDSNIDIYRPGGNGVAGGKTSKIIHKEPSAPKVEDIPNIEDLKKKSAIEVLRNIIKRLPRFLMLSDKKYENFKNVIEDIYQNSDASILFEDIMEIETSIFIEFVYNNNIIEYNKFKYFIEEFYRQFNKAKISSEWEEFENRWIYLDGEEKDIPFNIVEEIGIF